MGEDLEIQENPPPDSATDPSPGQEPVVSPATNEEVSPLRDKKTLAHPKEYKKHGGEEEGESRQPKRRRTSCPSAIATCTPVADNSGAVPSFSFDTKIPPIYSTPKFGSFSVPDLGTSDLQDLKSARSPEGAKGPKGEAGIEPDAKPLIELRSADGGDANKDAR